jgi:hypothetical protein
MNYLSKSTNGISKHPLKGLLIASLAIIILFSTYSVNSQSSTKSVEDPVITDIAVNTNPVTTNTLELALTEEGSLDVEADIYTLLGQLKLGLPQKTFEQGVAQQYDISGISEEGFYLLKLTDVSTDEVVFRKILID